MKDVSFSLRRGEILGFAGLMGAGRTEVARAVFGADRAQSGEIRVMRQEGVRPHARATPSPPASATCRRTASASASPSAWTSPPTW